MNRIIKNFVKNKFASAGVTIDGPNPWDIQVLDERFYLKVLQGSIGMGESYMNGWFDSVRLDECMTRVIMASLDNTNYLDWKRLFVFFAAKYLNRQSKKRSFEVAEKHYNLGNDLFRRMLDKRMVYSCAYWKDAKNLDEAQEAKLNLICRKLHLKPGMKVLDIGCGWGGFAMYAAEKYQVEVVGISVSEQQVSYVKEHSKGLPIECRLQDYRDIKDRRAFDAVVSIGQMEHVGYKNYQAYMKIVRQSLKKEGLFLLHTIGSLKTTTHTDPWIEKYIFPNGMIPSAVQLAESSEEVFVMEDWSNFGAYYDLTLMAWFRNFDNNWAELKEHYDERFYRMWKYYLLTCAGTFRSRETQLWQIVYSKSGIPGGYEAVR